MIEILTLVDIRWSSRLGTTKYALSTVGRQNYTPPASEKVLGCRNKIYTTTNSEMKWRAHIFRLCFLSTGKAKRISNLA